MWWSCIITSTIYCPVPSREETSLLVSDSTIQGLHIKQENGVRGTFTLPLVNTPDPWPEHQTCRRANQQYCGYRHTCSPTRCDFPRKRVWPWRSWVGWFLPCEQGGVCWIAVWGICFYHIYAFFFFLTLFLYLMHWMQHFPIFASHHHGNYRPIPACIFTKWHFSRSFISLPSTELSAHPFGVPHSAFLPLSHLSSFHLYFSLLIFVHQSQIFAYNVHGNDRVCKSF